MISKSINRAQDSGKFWHKLQPSHTPMLTTIPFTLTLFGGSTAAPLPNLYSNANDITSVINQGEQTVKDFVTQLDECPKLPDPVEACTTIARSLEGTVVQVVHDIRAGVSAEVSAAIFGIRNELNTIEPKISDFLHLVQNVTDITEDIGGKIGADGNDDFNCVISAIESTDKDLQTMIRIIEKVF